VTSIQAWLQERQYATPYHWHQRPNDEREYRLRTEIVFALAQLNGDRGARLLDVGCGDARFAADAAECARTVGVDVSRRALGFARTLVPAARFAAGTGAALPFRSNAFDIVTLLDVIEHIPDTDERRVVDEALRVLRPGGRLVISTNTDQSARELKHYRHYPLARFRSLFAGCRDIELHGLIPYFPTLRFWMASPVIWRCVRSRVQRCAPEHGQVVIGGGTKP
jgi:SAM-dependent methyltransferase